MASIVERKTAGGERRLYVTFHAIDRKTGKHRKVWELQPSTLKNEANARRAAVEVALRGSGGVWPAEAPQDASTFEAYAQRWLETHGKSLRPQTVEEYRRILERELYPTFGATLLTEIRRSDVKSHMATRAAAGAAANTVRNSIAPLRAILASAVDDGILTGNVAANLKRVGKEAKRIQPPTTEQVAVLIDAARDEFQPVLRAAASLGLRRGELYGLRWSDVDFDGRIVTVRASNIRGTLMEPKTEAGFRAVPMFEGARAALAAVKLRSRYSAPADLVFPTPMGTPDNPAVCVDREFQHALRKAKLGERSMRFHDLRHFAVSRLIAQGANILQLARVAGHSDPSVTLRVYAHLMNDGLSAAAIAYDPLKEASA